MICPKCGTESSGNYCSNCGAPLRWDEDGLDWVDGEDLFGEEPDRPDADHQAADRADRESREPADRSRRPADRPKGGRGRGDAKSIRAAAKEQKKKDARMKKLEGEVEKLRSRAAASEPKPSRASREERISREARTAREGRISREARTAREERIPREARAPREEQAPRKSWEPWEDREPRQARMAAETGETRRCRREEPGRGMGTDAGRTAGDIVGKGIAGAVVLTSRIMQLASALLMAAMVVLMLYPFWVHGQDLGDIRAMVGERNYGLALYVGFAGISLVMGVIWCLWILTRRGAGGGLRMKTYDTGRGFLPFLLCLAAVAAASLSLSYLPPQAEAMSDVARAARTAAEAVTARRDPLMACGILGAVLSLIRKILKV